MTLIMYSNNVNDRLPTQQLGVFVFVKERARESASGTSLGQPEFDTFPVRSSFHFASRHVPHFVFTISHQLSYFSSSTQLVPGCITNAIIDLTTYSHTLNVSS